MSQQIAGSSKDFQVTQNGNTTTVVTMGRTFKITRNPNNRRWAIKENGRLWREGFSFNECMLKINQWVN